MFGHVTFIDLCAPSRSSWYIRTRLCVCECVFVIASAAVTECCQWTRLDDFHSVGARCTLVRWLVYIHKFVNAIEMPCVPKLAAAAASGD